MSLIINMLKDLDKRDKQDSELPDISLKHATSTSRVKRLLTLKFDANKKTVMIIATAFIVITATILSIRHSNKYAANNILPFNKTQATTPTQPSATNNSEMTPVDAVSILGLTMQSGEQSTEIHFNLNKPFLYEINNENDTHLTVLFENATLQSTISPMDISNALVKSITSKQIGNDIQFDINMHTGWHLNLIDAHRNNDNYEFVVKLDSTKPLTKSNPPLATADTVLYNNEVKVPVSEDQINLKYQAALQTVQSGDKDTAINLLYGLLNESPSHHDARKSLIALLLETGKYSKAEKSIKKGLSISPDFIPYIELNARLLVTKNDITGAINTLRQHSPDINEYPDYYAFLAALYSHSNKDKLAANLYQQLVHIDSKNGNWWFGLALAMDKTGNQKEAKYAYTRALSRGKLNTVSLSYLHKRLETLQGG